MSHELMDALRQSGRKTGFENIVARFIYTIELKRRETMPPEYWPMDDDEWPGATADEMALVREWLAEDAPL